MIDSVCEGECEADIGPILALKIPKLDDAYVCTKCGGNVTKIKFEMFDGVYRQVSGLAPGRNLLTGCNQNSVEEAKMHYENR